MGGIPDTLRTLLITANKVGAWRSLVARLNGVQKVASSNLAAPTISSFGSLWKPVLSTPLSGPIWLFFLQTGWLAISAYRFSNRHSPSGWWCIVVKLAVSHISNIFCNKVARGCVVVASVFDRYAVNEAAATGRGDCTVSNKEQHYENKCGRIDESRGLECVGGVAGIGEAGRWTAAQGTAGGSPSAG